ncbi:plasmid partitioning protein RepA [Pseudooceanicola sp. CBS1P-1]|uniref:Plasmid partitioning protein RepA n=1 Tax=Pseudooceanicola albus TaxID=2692189 RepID=A0A6L7G9A2_9RHOB|nr:MULTISPECIES: plasmid partitioning protein RepA [Pseudooceanicola]MBT9384382.1 plasmid partitioning protein RepA [Pseudooceanicola endophyticus]MXN19880.1 plasmid partitioning protein RepA [Pseudooceanicola albus]
MAVSGSATLDRHANLIAEQLVQHRDRLLEPKKVKELRSFSFKEACHYLGVKENSLRHTLRTNESLPQGTLIRGTRRHFAAEEIHAIRDHLIANDRLEPENITRRMGDEQTVVIASINLKGGVGKSTSAQHLAQGLAMRGYKTLVIDLDAQASLTQLFGIIPEREPDMLTLYHAIRYHDEDDDAEDAPVDIRNVVRGTHMPNLDLIPCSMQIMEFEHETAGRDQRRHPFFIRIEEALAPIRDDYDVILFDCPPQMSFAVMAALFTCTSLLVTVTASFVDVMSLGTFLGMTGEMMSVIEQRQGERPYDWIKYLITRYNPTDQPSVQVAGYLRSILEDSVMTNEFYLSTAISDAAVSSDSIVEVDPSTFHRQTYQRAWDSVARVTAELEGLIHQAWGRE